MRLLPRHYVLIAIILLFGIYNIVRMSRGRRTITPSAAPAVTSRLPRPESPAWAAFDQAAAQRDAPDAAFQAALHALEQQSTTASAPEDAGLSGCKTWLLFYRQGIVHPSLDKSWHTRSTGHLDSCVKNHDDIAS